MTDRLARLTQERLQNPRLHPHTRAWLERLYQIKSREAHTQRERRTR